MLYNVVLVSAIQHESAISIHLSPPSRSPHTHFRLSQSIRLSSLCYTATFYYISILHMVMCNAEEAEAEQFYKDLQDLLELIPKKDVLFIIGD